MKDLTSRIGQNEYKYVKEVLDTQFRSSKGAHMMTRLEQEFSARFGVKYAICQVNGTATLHSVLEAWGIGAGDEVIVPPLTMASTTFAVLQANATPVFVDVDPNTFELDATQIEAKITKKTKAIITVALFGLCPDMDPILQLAHKYNLRVLEDNAECFLGTYKGRLVGTLADAASFSFQSSKHLTAGEGGIVITNDLDTAINTRRVSSLGYAGVGAQKGKITKKDIQDPRYCRHVQMGWNYRMSELCAAVALGQLENIEALVNRRKEVAQLFSQAVQGYDWLQPQQVGKDYTHSYWTWAVKLTHPGISWYTFRDKFQELGGDGIYAAWKITYLEPMFQQMSLLRREQFISAENRNQYKPGLCPVAEQLQGQLLQFKTNYWDFRQAVKQAEILRATVSYFSNK